MEDNVACENNLDMLEKPFEPENEERILDRTVLALREAFCDAGRSRLDQAIGIAGAIVANRAERYMNDEPTRLLQLKQWQMIVNAAVSCYLGIWLRRDKRAYQNIRSFIYHPFQDAPLEAAKKSEMYIYDENNCPYGDDGAEKEKKQYENYFKYGFNQSYEMMEWRQEQAKEEESQILPLPKRGRKQSIIECSYIDLIYAEAFHNKRLKLWELAVAYKSVLKSTTDHGSNEKLREAWIDFIAFAKEIGELGERLDQDGDLPAYKRYVASCMMLTEFEEANRFVLVGKIAKKVKEKKTAWNKEKREALCDVMNGFWGRYPASLIDAIMGQQNARPNNVNNTINAHYNLLNYDAEIDIAVQADLERVALGVRDNMILRNVLNETIAYLIAVIPVSERDFWSEEDYFAAVRFYRERFPIADMIANLEVPDLEKETNSEKNHYRRKKDYYDIFREIYTYWLLFDGSPLKESRSKYLERRKK